MFLKKHVTIDIYKREGKMKLTYTRDEAKEFLQNAIDFFEAQKSIKTFSVEAIDKTCKKLEKKLRRVSTLGISKSKKELANQRIDAYKAVYYLLKSNEITKQDVDFYEVKRLAAALDLKKYLKEINTFQPLSRHEAQDFSM